MGRRVGTIPVPALRLEQVSTAARSSTAHQGFAWSHQQIDYFSLPISLLREV